MTGKDPEDMTASELLRRVVNDCNENITSAMSIVDQLRKTVGSKETRTYGEDLAIALETVAGKIDVEIEAARRDAGNDTFMTILDRLITFNSYPSRSEGEGFVGWLKRCFIPRSRYEDGEPVQFGDYDIDWDEIDRCPGTAQWEATAVDCRGRLLATAFSGIVAVAKTDENGRVKRRTPEVPGADGLPIKAGETVWDTKSGLEIVVSRIAKDDGGNVIVCANGDICELQFAPKDVTHARPDTQERIDGDSQKTADAYWGCIDVSCEDCPAKIDGKSPHTRFDARNCVQAQMIDLLRRQRELDARKGGAE